MIYLFSIWPWEYKTMDLPENLNYDDYDCWDWRTESKIKNWKPFPVEWVKSDSDDSAKELPSPDMGIFAGGPPSISPKAYAALKDRLKGYVEFLPVEHRDEGETWYLMNVTKRLDIMDKEKSIYEIYSSGEVGQCQHAFIDKPEAENHLIFKIKGCAPNIFINDTMKTIIEDNDLKGPLIREYVNPE